MSFGIPAALNPASKAMISLTQAGSVNVADMSDADGVLLDQHTYGASITVSSDFYLKRGEFWINGATNGQSGESVVTASSLMSTSNAYQHVTETTRWIPIPGSTVAIPGMTAAISGSSAASNP